MRLGLKNWHDMLGLSVLFLAMFRAAVNFTSVVPRIVPELQNWHHHFARLMQMVLYMLMICMSILERLTLSAEGELVTFFGLKLPQLLGKNKLIADLAKEFHEAGGRRHGKLLFDRSARIGGVVSSLCDSG
jgi:cytochrome b561